MLPEQERELPAAPQRTALPGHGMKEHIDKEGLLAEINGRVAVLAAARGVSQPCFIGAIERVTNARAPANWTWHRARPDVSTECTQILGDVVTEFAATHDVTW